MYRMITHGKSQRKADSFGEAIGAMQGIHQQIKEGSAPQMEVVSNLFLNILRANVEVIQVQQKLLQQMIGTLEAAMEATPPKPAASGGRRSPEKVKVK